MPALLELLRRSRETARLMVGVPDYQGYLAHQREAHPGEEAMTLRQFHCTCIERRYGGGPNGTFRCC